MKESQKIRIQKAIACSGIASRRKAEQLIVDGLVKVNGKPVSLGDRINIKTDRLTIRDKKIQIKQNRLSTYIMLNKPRGYVSTLSDEKGRLCLKDLVKKVKFRIYPVGRLDRNSEGLLLMTNDGEFANRLIQPSSNIAKIYRVTIKPNITEAKIRAMRAGMILNEYQTKPADVEVISRDEDRVVLKIILREGKNRQIRKMCEALDLTVARLKRIGIGSLKLGSLKPGQWRNLTDEEKKLIFKE